jgi:hypothetical protein
MWGISPGAHGIMPLSAFTRPVDAPMVDTTDTPLALLSATARGLAESGTPLKIALLALYDAYGLEVCELEVDDVAGHNLVSLHRPAEV